MILNAERASLTVEERELVTSGSVNVCPVEFRFSADWDGLERTAVFRAGDRTVSVLLGVDGRCTVPWEVLMKSGDRLYAGVYGTCGGEAVLPTVWADLGLIREGATLGEDAGPRPATAYERLLKEIQSRANGLDWDGKTLTLMAGEKELAKAEVGVDVLTEAEVAALWGGKENNE